VASQFPPPWLLAVVGGLWAVFWYGLVLLAFGIAPSFPPAVAVGAGLLLAGAALVLLPRWTAGSGWRPTHTFAVIFGTMVGSMLVGFIGFIGAAPLDLYFKIVVNILAIVLMIMLGVRVSTSANELQSKLLDSQPDHETLSSGR
jgi:hypothetical protein